MAFLRQSFVNNGSNSTPVWETIRKFVLRKTSDASMSAFLDTLLTHVASYIERTNQLDDLTDIGAGLGDIMLYLTSPFGAQTFPEAKQALYEIVRMRNERHTALVASYRREYDRVSERETHENTLFDTIKELVVDRQILLIHQELQKIADKYTTSNSENSIIAFREFTRSNSFQYTELSTYLNLIRSHLQSIKNNDRSLISFLSLTSVAYALVDESTKCIKRYGNTLFDIKKPVVGSDYSSKPNSEIRAR